MKSFTPKSHPLLALIITIVTAICVVTILLLGATDNHSRTIRTSASYRELRNMNVTLEGSDSFAGVVRTYTCYLPDLPIWGEDLFIYFVHEYADVWLDDETHQIKFRIDEESGEQILKNFSSVPDLEIFIRGTYVEDGVIHIAVSADDGKGNLFFGTIFTIDGDNISSYEISNPDEPA